MDGCPLTNGDDEIFTKLNYVLLQMSKLENLTLLGTGIAENLGDLCQSFRAPGIRSLDLKYNGIEQSCFTTYFKHMINFDYLHTLDIGSNWFGTNGLNEIGDEFLRFRCLKSLKISTSKLCFGPPTNVTIAARLASVLLKFPTIEELELHENSINATKMAVLAPSLVKLDKLKVLNLGKNPIEYEGLNIYLKLLIQECAPDKSTQLEKIILHGCFLKNEGVHTFLEVMMEHPNVFANLKKINMNAVSMDDLSLPILKKFISSFPLNHLITIELKKQSLFGKKLIDFKNIVNKTLKENKDRS